MKLIILLLAILVSVYLLIIFTPSCKYSVIAKQSQKARFSGICISNKNNYSISYEDYSGSLKDNISHVYRLDADKMNEYELHGLYCKQVIYLRGVEYALVNTTNKINAPESKIYSKIVAMANNKDILKFDVIIDGIIATSGSKLYAWNNNSVYEIDIINWKITNYYSGLDIRLTPLVDTSGDIHLITNNKYAKIKNAEIAFQEHNYGEIYLTTIDNDIIYFLTKTNNNINILQHGASEPISVLNSRYLPISFFKTGHAMTVVASDSSILGASEYIYTSLDNGKSWKRCQIDIDQAFGRGVGLAWDGSIIMKLSGSGEIVKMDPKWCK